MKKVLHIAALLLIASLSSCIKEELPVEPHKPGDVLTATVDMNEDYKWQIFYNLKDNNIVSKNLKNDWDLGFEAAPDGYHVILNGAMIMFAYNTGKTDFDAVSFKDTTGFAEGKKVDMPGGSLDSTAIGDWRKEKPVYILTNNERVFYKFQVVSLNENNYEVRFAKMTGADAGKTMVIKKDGLYNFMFLSFAKGETVTVEPPKANWDIVFTNYTHVFYHLNTTYSVTGCLLNRNNTFAVMDSTVKFEEINYTNVSDYKLSPEINSVGYDWKVFYLDKYIYVTFPNMNYIIRTADGSYYKLRFVDFTKNNIKGNPKWEYQKL